MHKNLILLSIYFLYISSTYASTIAELRIKEWQEVMKERARMGVLLEPREIIINGIHHLLYSERDNNFETLQTKAIANALNLVERKGFRVPSIHFYLSAEPSVRNVAFFGNATGKDEVTIFLGPKLYKLNPMVGSQDIIHGGLGSAGARGVADQIADRLGDHRSRAQENAKATAIIVHELGHFFHLQNDPNKFWSFKNTPPSITGYKPEKVSHYATQNGLEFVAEMFTAAIYGLPMSEPLTILGFLHLGGPPTVLKD